MTTLVGRFAVHAWTVAAIVFSLCLCVIALSCGSSAWAQSENQIRRYDDGGVYEGPIEDGMQHGIGTYRLPNGYSYTGEWVMGEILGKGRAEYPNGSVYEGNFVRGKPDGYGKIVFADGGTYEGEWVSGEITGHGMGIYANKVRYAGEFENALHHGYGLMTYPNGTYWYGSWRNGKRAERKSVEALRSEFNDLRAETRKIVQQVLAERQYYSAAIDGLWGVGTLTAIAQFAAASRTEIRFFDKAASSQLLARISGDL